MKTKTTPFHVSTSTPAVVSGFTLGLDLGDRAHHVCVLDATGQIVREASLPNTRPALAQLLADFPHATVALEAGTHSPWISRYLTDCGAKVLVAKPESRYALYVGASRARAHLSLFLSADLKESYRALAQEHAHFLVETLQQPPTDGG
jgi:Transposase